MIDKFEARAEYLLIQESLDIWNDRLRALRLMCPHTDATKKYNSNTGNYDPSADCYWIEWYCPDCNDRWREDVI